MSALTMVRTLALLHLASWTHALRRYAASPATKQVLLESDGRTTVRIVGALTANNATATFFDVPYAAQPARFAPSVAGSFVYQEGTYDAAAANPAKKCFQGADSQSGSEDGCFYLDIYAPADAAPGDRRPVLFYIHGGGFTGGDKSNERWFSYTQDVWPEIGVDASTRPIVVTANYRVSLLGFLRHPALSPTQWLNGLGDCIEALKWTQSHIAAFGGDPDSVTIMGQSAGGGAVLALWKSPMAQHLFSKAIAMSPYGAFRAVDSNQDGFSTGAAECVAKACAGKGDDDCNVYNVDLAALYSNCTQQNIEGNPCVSADFEKVFAWQTSGVFPADGFILPTFDGMDPIPGAKPLLVGNMDREDTINIELQEGDTAFRRNTIEPKDEPAKQLLDNLLEYFNFSDNDMRHDDAFGRAWTSATYGADLGLAGQPGVWTYQFKDMGIPVTKENLEDPTNPAYFRICGLPTHGCDISFYMSEMTDVVAYWAVDPMQTYGNWAQLRASGYISAKLYADIRMAWLRFAMTGEPGWQTTQVALLDGTSGLRLADLECTTARRLIAPFVVSNTPADCSALHVARSSGAPALRGGSHLSRPLLMPAAARHHVPVGAPGVDWAP